MESVKILCFGDSLTEGYSQWGMLMTPYADSMKEKLQTAWPSTKFTVDVSGLSGDRVISGLFLPRFKAKCNPAVKDKYDWIVILGGTNDLGFGLKPDVIFAGLKKIYEIARDHGANVLAITIPECAVINKSLDGRRDELNTLIKDYNGGQFYTLDLYALMPYHSMSDKESREKIWDDGLHFTPDGYSVMGHHIATRLSDLMMNLEAKDIKSKQETMAGMAREEYSDEART